MHLLEVFRIKNISAIPHRKISFVALHLKEKQNNKKNRYVREHVCILCPRAAFKPTVRTLAWDIYKSYISSCCAQFRSEY